jgi:Fe-S-cluster containining protein
VTESEIVALAAKVGLSLDSFGRAYLRRIGSRFSLVEKGNHDCIFWREGTGCSVYEARPEQCRTFPFWPELIASREGWESVDWCQGKDQGRVYERPEIEALARGEGHTS